MLAGGKDNTLEYPDDEGMEAGHESPNKDDKKDATNAQGKTAASAMAKAKAAQQQAGAQQKKTEGEKKREERKH